MVTDTIIEKWKNLINACKAYYIDSLPTGMTDSEYDFLENQALHEDGFSVRDYVFQEYLKGTKTKNSYIEKIKKTKVTGSMLDYLIKYVENLELGTDDVYVNLKHDGSSLAIYLDPSTGIPLRIVTVGNLNIDDYGVDQTWKLINFLPRRFPIGITAIQAEALINIQDLGEENADRARQKANGLINSKYCEDEVNQLLTIRAYRYYLDPQYGAYLDGSDYREVLRSFGTVQDSVTGHIKFAPATIWTISELQNTTPGFMDTQKTDSGCGVFLNDGWVVYSKFGVCLGALKYSGAGSGTEGTTTVRGIQWNSQVAKGKDSFSVNVLVDPINVLGCTVKKPSGGSVGKMVRNNITPGAKVSIIMANSTIPMVGEVHKPGNGDFNWPVCGCGYQTSKKDIYGSLLKCGNQECTERENRMRKYISGLSQIEDINLDRFLVIDRFKWDGQIQLNELLKTVEKNMPSDFYDLLLKPLTTDLQKRNLELVWKSAFKILRETYETITGI